MSADFLITFMHVAMEITGAERSMVVDAQLRVQQVVNLDVATIEAPFFSTPAIGALHQAINTGTPVITNNTITDPSQAPVTNTNYSDLRVVVAIPVGDLGAVYLDQHIRLGIFPRDIIDRLAQLASVAIESGRMESSEDDLIQLYKTLD